MSNETRSATEQTALSELETATKALEKAAATTRKALATIQKINRDIRPNTKPTNQPNTDKTEAPNPQLVALGCRVNQQQTDLFGINGIPPWA